MSVYNPIIDSPTGGSTIDATIINRFSWQFLTSTGDTTVQFSYRVLILNLDNTTAHDSGIVSSANEYYDLPATTLTNGNDYKWRVTVNGIRTPIKASVFNAQDTAVATVDAIPNPFLVQLYEFTGTVTQAQGDIVRSFQWTLYDSGDVVVTQSPVIIGEDVKYEFSGLANSTTYKVDFDVTMQSGLTSTSNRPSFTTNYTSPVDPDAIDVTAREDLIMNKMDWTAIVTQTGNVYDSTDTIISASYTTGVWNQALDLGVGDYVRYDLNAPIPLIFSGNFFIKLASGYDGAFFKLYDNTTGLVKYEIGYLQSTGAFYYERDFRRVNGLPISLPSGFFKIILNGRYFGYEISSVQYIVR